MDKYTEKIKLSKEQQLFIDKAKWGDNILVDACIGSGKTTAIQHLCDELPSNLKILYLTYNKLLKLDAKTKIRNKNVTVTNYHGFAYNELKKVGKLVGISDLVQTFNKVKPKTSHYDVLIIDEYQDIEQELADMLLFIKSCNPKIQIIAVGDMEQKIYDKTTLNVPEFIERFLGKHLKLEFTQCFRLSADLATKLGRIWQKCIIGVNTGCVVEEMDLNSVLNVIASYDTQDILCLGARTGELAETLNLLEENYPEKFNKNTVYASIRDDDGNTGATNPDKTSAIFTTFDASKGLERKLCVVFDFTESYWEVRIDKPQQSYKILRNIFCVAASRGKERIIFVKHNEDMLSEQTLSTPREINLEFTDVDISSMFDFKYKEDIEECFSHLSVSKTHKPNQLSEINIKNSDGLIDLSPCIGIYQEALYFKKYEINEEIELYFDLHKDKQYLYSADIFNLNLDDKILFITSLHTKQNRYRIQVDTPFVTEEGKQRIIDRLGEKFSRDENVQARCQIDFCKDKNARILFSAIGFADVIKDETVYELKFVAELSHEHFLQCASYMIALGLSKGVLWNTRNNECYAISIPNPQTFMDAVVKAVTKGYLGKYYAKN